MKISIYLFLISPILTFGQWIERQTPVANLEYIYFINDSTGYCGNEYVSFQTTDSGWTWQNATGDYVNFKQACFTGSLNGFAISNTDLFQTSDGGQTWLSISDSLSISEYYSLEERNGQVIVNGRNPATGFYWYVSVDEGQSWELRNQNPHRSPEINHILDEHHFFLADPYNHTIASSSDGGLSWDTVHHQVFIDDYLTSIYFATPDSGVIGYQSHWGGGWIERTYDGIHNFQRTPSGIDSVFTHGVFFIEGSGNTICGGGEDGYFYCSPNRGENWFLQPVNANDYLKTLHAAYFFDEQRAAIVGNSGRVLLTNEGTHNPLRREEHTVMARVSVYPNPFHEYTTIETNMENIYIRVVNSVGQVCYESKHQLSGNVRITNSELSGSGVYYVQIFQKQQLLETRKLIMVDR